jgi:lambda family phage portal protein
MNAFEKIIGFFSPSLAAERAKNRLLLESFQDLKRSYDAGTRGRRGAGWATSGEEDPNIDIARSLAVLRNRSRNLYKNNRWAKKAVRTIALNTIGTGVQPTPKGKSRRATERVKQVWKDWAEEKTCDFYGRKNMYALQMLAMRTVVISGEVLVVRRRTPSETVPFKIQVLEGDFLDMNKNTLTTDRGRAENFIVQGVEFDSEGKRVAYWIYDHAPTNMNAVKFTSKRVSAEDVLHIFEEERPGQVRGVPFLAASMLQLRDFDDYEDAQLVRQKIAACFSVFVTQSPTGIGLPGEDGEREDGISRVEPGIVERLSPGESVQFASPPAAEGYADYSRKIQQGIAAGAGITYEQLSGDLSNVNFSSGRMGWIEAHRQIEDWQFNMFIPDFCGGIWNWLNDALVARGVISELVKAEWTPQGRMMIDPTKETAAMSAMLGAGLQSWTEAVKERGYDPDVLLTQIKEDADKLRELGIPFEWLYGKASRRPPESDE